MIIAHFFYMGIGVGLVMFEERYLKGFHERFYYYAYHVLIGSAQGRDGLNVIALVFERRNRAVPV